MQWQVEIDKSTMIVGNFNNSPSETDISSRIENISTVKLTSLYKWMGLTLCTEQTEIHIYFFKRIFKYT